MKKVKFLFLAAMTGVALTFSSCNNENKTDDAAMMEHSDMENHSEMNDENKSGDAMMEQGVMVGGANMVASKDIVDNAVNSSEHTTLVAAVKEAGLVETLKMEGPYTVFAPTNEAFAEVNEAVTMLMKPENNAKLKGVLTYHVIAGKALKAADMTDGQKLTTVEGEELTVMKKDGSVMIKDAKGNMATVTIADVVSSNGVTHVVNKVLMPAK